MDFLFTLAEPARGVVVAHAPATNRAYLGSPSLVRLADGTLVASHDFFGPGSDGERHTNIYASDDDGASWRLQARLAPQFWSGLFLHRGALYLMGPGGHHGPWTIRRSEDAGKTWTVPADSASGLILPDPAYHTAPMPVLHHAGRLWRALEDVLGGGGWGGHFRVRMLSAPEDADLLDARSWMLTNPLPGDPRWLEGGFGGWLEGNAVATPEGEVVNILRVHCEDENERAAIVRVRPDGAAVTFDPERDFIAFPGGCKKFTIRRHPRTGRYGALANWVPPTMRQGRPERTRNTLAWVTSTDLRHWSVECVVLQHPDREFHGFQYANWFYEGNDIVALVRTAHDDGIGGAHNCHDSNFITFHRFVGLAA